MRRGLEPILVGNAFARVEQRRKDLRFPFPKRFAERLTGRKVEALDRRAKYLLARLDDGEVLVIHLGMSGRFSIDRANGAAEKPGRFAHPQGDAPKHEHIVFHLKDGAAVRYTDPRRFGLMDLVCPPTRSRATHFSRVSGSSRSGRASRRNGSPPSSSGQGDLDQGGADRSRLIAGIGNIYACEALFRAGISPLKLAGSLATKTGKPTARNKSARPWHQGGARRRDPSGRLVVSRL